MTEIRKVACHYCHMNCGMLAHVEDGVITKIVGDPDHPYNAGAQCPRGASTLEHLNHPNRINYPLKRVGDRGSGRFERVSWEEALDDIAARITDLKNRYGAETITSIGGTNRTDDFARRRFFNILGSPNIIHTAPICWIPNFLTEVASYGWGAFDAEVMGGSRCCVVWGHNPGASYMPEMKSMLMAREQFGTKLVVIDPIYTETAAKADIWLPIRPNSDNALALAWLNVIVNEGLYDMDFVANWTVGFEELYDRVQEFTPEWAEAKTGVPAEKITEAARLYATSKPACIAWGVAPDQLGRGSSKGAQARVALRAITGNIDVPGGDVIPGPHPTFITDWELELNELLSEEQRAKQIGSDRFKLNSWPGYRKLSESLIKVWGKSIPAEWFCEAHPPSLFRAMISGKPYPVKGSIIMADNPLISYSNTKLIYEALKSLDLLVAMEYWMTPSAMLADYVLPAASWIERPLMTTTYGVSDFLIASQRGVQPLYERKTDLDFWKELGRKLGQGEYWPWETDEDVFYYRLSNIEHGVDTYDEFVEYYRFDFAPRDYKKHETRGFATPSGKVELKISVMEDLGYDPLPNYVIPPFTHEANPDLAEEYPVILIAGGGFMPFFHSEHREISRLRLLRPDPRVVMNPKLAREYGINDGDWVWIETPIGRIKQRAFLSEAIRPGYVQGERGWWFPEMEAKDPVLMGVFESNVNAVLNDDPDFCDEATGAWCTRTAQCRIYKVKEGA